MIMMFPTLLLELLFISSSIGIMRGKRSRKPRVCISIDLPAALFCAEHRISERLRRLIGELSRAERLEPRLALVESALRCFTRAVELVSQFIDKRHFCLLVSGN